MPTVDEVKSKVQRMLTNRFGSVKIDKDGDFVVQYESAVVFVRVIKWGDDQTIVQIQCPMVKDVKITPELTRWIAVDGQDFVFGGTYLRPNEDEKTGWVYFQNNLLGDDLDESELESGLDAVVLISNRIDNEIKDKFGGKLFGPEN